MSALQMKFRKNRMGGLEGARRRGEDGGCRIRREKKPRQKDFIRETVGRRKIEVEMILKR